MRRVVYQYSSPLVKSSFVERTNRFVCKIKSQLKDVGDEKRDLVEDVYCPNTGSMLNLVPTPDNPQRSCYITDMNSGKGKTGSSTTKRKYSKTLEVVEDGGALVGIHSRLANDMVAKALEKGLIPELRGFDQIKREVRACDFSSAPQNSNREQDIRTGALKRGHKKEDKMSRLDFQLLQTVQQPKRASDESNDSSSTADTTKVDRFCAFTHVKSNLMMEVKSVTLVASSELVKPYGTRQASFPDRSVQFQFQFASSFPSLCLLLLFFMRYWTSFLCLYLAAFKSTPSQSDQISNVCLILTN
eukprot:GSChrysophyteH1.ASY1.ANO1.1443.1 assembled CDS